MAMVHGLYINFSIESTPNHDKRGEREKKCQRDHSLHDELEPVRDIKKNNTIENGGITVDFWITKVHTSNQNSL